MARAKEDVREQAGLYERDYYLWVEEQVRLLGERRFDELDLVNLIDEVGDLGISHKQSITGNLVVVLLHLLKHQYQPRRRSRSWLTSIEEHRRRRRKDFQHSPSLRGYARDELIEATGTPGGRPRSRPACRPKGFPISRPGRSSRRLIPTSCRTDGAAAGARR